MDMGMSCSFHVTSAIFLCHASCIVSVIDMGMCCLFCFVSTPCKLYLLDLPRRRNVVRRMDMLYQLNFFFFVGQPEHWFHYFYLLGISRRRLAIVLVPLFLPVEEDGNIVSGHFFEDHHFYCWLVHWFHFFELSG